MGLFLGALMGVIIALMFQCGVTYWQHKKNSEAITNALCSEVASILNLITVRGYRSGIVDNINSIDLEISRLRALKDIDGIDYNNPDLLKENHAFFRPFLMMHFDLFWHIYKSNACNIGMTGDSLSLLIPKFYSLIFSILEDAQYAAENVLSTTERWNINGIDLYYNRLIILKNYYQEDLKLLDEIIRIGKEIENIYEGKAEERKT